MHSLWSSPEQLSFWILRCKLPSQTLASCASAYKPLHSWSSMHGPPDPALPPVSLSSGTIHMTLPSLGSLGCLSPGQHLGSLALQHSCLTQFTSPACLSHAHNLGCWVLQEDKRLTMQVGATPDLYSPDWALIAAGKFFPLNHPIDSPGVVSASSWLLSNDFCMTLLYPIHPQQLAFLLHRGKPILRQELLLLLPPHMETSLHCCLWQPLASCYCGRGGRLLVPCH